MRSIIFKVVSVGFLSCVSALLFAQGLPRSPAPDGAEVYFISPANGAVLTSPVTVRFGLRNMGVAPAGADLPETGHHHLLLNLDELPPMNMPLPATEQVIHFGKGQTETRLNLEPGVHTMQLLMGNYLHIPHEEAVISERITITVR